MKQYRKLTLIVKDDCVRVRWVYDEYEECHHIIYEERHFFFWKKESDTKFSIVITAKNEWRRIVDKILLYA